MNTYGNYRYWTPTRARNFVKILRLKPTNFAENMQILANTAHFPTRRMQDYCNPITFGMACFPRSYRDSPKQMLLTLLGQSSYDELLRMCPPESLSELALRFAKEVARNPVLSTVPVLFSEPVATTATTATTDPVVLPEVHCAESASPARSIESIALPEIHEPDAGIMRGRIYTVCLPGLQTVGSSRVSECCSPHVRHIPTHSITEHIHVSSDPCNPCDPEIA